MDKDSFISLFPYVVVLVIAPVALLLDFPVAAIAACTLGLIIVVGFFGGFVQLPLMLVLLSEIAVGFVRLAGLGEERSEPPELRNAGFVGNLSSLLADWS